MSTYYVINLEKWSSTVVPIGTMRVTRFDVVGAIVAVDYYGMVREHSDGI